MELVHFAISLPWNVTLNGATNIQINELILGPLKELNLIVDKLILVLFLGWSGYSFFRKILVKKKTNWNLYYKAGNNEYW